MKKREFSSKDRVAIVQFLMHQKKNEKLQKGAITLAAKQFKCNRMTISRIWKRASENNCQGESYANVDSLKKQNCGRKCKDYGEKLEKLRHIPLSRRGTIRSAAHAIEVPKSTLFRILKKGKSIKRVSSTIKPFLTEKNKKDRVEFCLSKVLPDGKFMDFKDYIHIDEKWFYLTKCKRSYYVLLDEETPHRTCKSKRFISKVMFMAAVARPRWDPHKKCLFDGKIGIWPFVTQTPAQRNSKNRTKGTLITKPIESVTSTEIRKMFFENILPTIRKKWPRGSRHCPIFIQQDNAKPHLKDDDPLLLEEGFRDGWKIQMKSQPPNSPDFNVLDLGFFNSMQSLQHQASPNNIDELIEAVNIAFDNISPEILDNTFLSLQQVMLEAMKNDGSNNFKLTHIGKAKLRSQGILPTSLKCSNEIIEKSRNYLNTQNKN